ncbi:MAG: T9SS type A sorting domain-containing protein [Bacteroidales bacterium]|jgi:hypothetical protein|nr:T9SS type A sorting domain-containing protein [Bacteroidales bacterium]
MKKILFLIFALSICLSLSAQRYSSTDLRDIKFNALANDVDGSNYEAKFVPSQRTSSFIPQSKCASFDIGETFYITVTNCNARNTINWSPDGKTCAATWTSGAPPGNPRPRGTQINYFDESSTSWGPLPSVNPFDRIEDLPLTGAQPGWGTHVYTQNGECVMSHCTDQGGMVVNYREKRGEGDWTQYILKGPELSNGKTDILWPSLYAVGDVIHMVCVTSNDDDVFLDGIPTCPLYFRSTDGGKTWEPYRKFDEVMPEIDRYEVSADGYAVTARDNHVVIAYTCGLAAYLESFDGGDTWERHLIYDVDWNGHSEGVWVGPAMCARSIGVTIGDDDKVHIAFGAQMRLRDPNTLPGWVTTFPALCGMYTWSEGQPMMKTEDFDFKYDYDNEKWIESDGYRLVPNFLDAPDLLGLEEFYWWRSNPDQPIDLLSMIGKCYGNTGYITFPRLIAQDNKVYLMYNSIIEQPMNCVEPEKFFRGVFLTVSHDNGETYKQNENTSWLSYRYDMFFCDWSGYEGPNLVDTSYSGFVDFILSSENGFATMATTIRNYSLVFTWLNDMFPFPDEATWQNISYRVVSENLKLWDAGIYNNTQEVWKNMWNKVEEKEIIENLNVYPNPASNKVIVNVDNFNPYTLTLTNIMGQVVYSTQGKGKTEIDVAKFPAGIYIVNVKTAHASASQKLIVK